MCFTFLPELEGHKGWKTNKGWKKALEFNSISSHVVLKKRLRVVWVNMNARDIQSENVCVSGHSFLDGGFGAWLWLCLLYLVSVHVRGEYKYTFYCCFDNFENLAVDF